MTHDMFENCMENLMDLFLFFFVVENLHQKFENIKKSHMTRGSEARTSFLKKVLEI